MNQFERAAPDSPHRCQAVNRQGQCRNKGIPLPDGGFAEYCLAHGGSAQQRSAIKESARNYKLDRWRARLNEKADAEGIKSLRDEIGILRICLEERLNRCNDATDLILQSGPISDMVMKIERVVNSCHKLEGSMGQLLDKQALLQFANKAISIISTHVTDENLLTLIADELVEAL